MIVPDQVEEYAAAHSTPPTELLQSLAAETRETLRAPQMLTGTIEGRFLELLVFGLGARRVLELGTMYAAPTAGRMLRDFGADVTKVEDPDTGDFARHWTPQKDGLSLGFARLNG